MKLYKSTGIGFDVQAEILADYRAMEASGAFREEGLAARAGTSMFVVAHHSQLVIIAGPGMLLHR